MESSRLSGRDREFLQKLKFFIDSELSYFPPNVLSKERYIVFQQAFNQVYF